MLISLKVGEVVINPELRTIVGPAGLERTSPNEMTLLLELLCHRGLVVRRERLMELIADDDKAADGACDKIIDVYLSRLRKLFEKVGSELPVRNVFGYGFHVDLPFEAGSVTAVFTPSEWEAVKFCVSHAEGRNPGIRLRTGIDRQAIGIKVNERLRQDAAVGRVVA